MSEKEESRWMHGNYAKPGPVTDVVYVLGTGSRWNDNELRFSLRSLEKNLKDFRNIYIVGECPEFLQNVIHVPAVDIFEPAINADGNIITKVLAACKCKELSDDFLFINDDHLVLQPVAAIDVPSLHHGDMTTFPPDYWKLNYWRGRLKRTMEVLRQNNYTTLHFDCHTPIVFNKHIFPEIMGRFSYSDGIGYTMKSLYGNVMYPDGEFLTDQKKKIFKNYRLDEIRRMLTGPMFMSFNDQGLNKSLKWWLIDNFKTKCSYETNYPEDRVFDLYQWMFNGKQWDDGVKVYNRYYTNPHFKAMFACGETPVLMRKMEYILNLEIKNL
jgi:hypothetical protein